MTVLRGKKKLMGDVIIARSHQPDRKENHDDYATTE